MEGRPYEELHEFCDFTLLEQNEVFHHKHDRHHHHSHQHHHHRHSHDHYHQATTSKGAQPLAPADFQPVVKKSVCYIVAAVLFNEKNEVKTLMMTMMLLLLLLMCLLHRRRALQREERGRDDDDDIVESRDNVVLQSMVRKSS